MNENYQIAVIGTGSGGSEAAILAAKKGFKVVVIENGGLGGTRFHHGSYAVRALHASARIHSEFFKGEKNGVEAELFANSLIQWMKAQRAASARLARSLQNQLEMLNIRVAFGRGTLVDEHRIRITSEHEKQEEIEADNIILATGARPDYLGSQDSRLINSDQLLDRINPPSHLFIVGGGYVGCEFAAIYRRFGCQITLAEQSERLLGGWDESVGTHIAQRLAEDGVELILGRQIPVHNLPMKEGRPIIAKSDGTEFSPDLVLVATGRRPNIESLGLAELGINATPFVEVDGQLRTQRKNIFAVGDVNGLNMLDSAAASQAQVAIDALTGGTTLFGSRWVPRYLDTDPPVAAVGWMEHEAAEAGLDVGVESEVAEMVTSDDKTVDQPSKTMIKIITERSTKQIRGCVAIGNQASEVINLAALAIQSGIGTREIERLLLVHPSASVAFQRCASKFHDENRWHPSIMKVLGAAKGAVFPSAY
jgi:pyruvate/2-oxoglutarate dehydrogenase complex dihydrolipoamide dehydrogenase (E3) component